MKYIKLFETFTEAPYEWDKEEYDQFKSEYDEIANIKLEIEICKNNIERNEKIRSFLSGWIKKDCMEPL